MQIIVKGESLEKIPDAGKLPNDLFSSRQVMNDIFILLGSSSRGGGKVLAKRPEFSMDLQQAISPRFTLS